MDIATLLQALSDPVRLQIVRQIAGRGEDGEISCGELDVPCGKSTCSHHIKTLYAAGITAEREEGTRKHLRLRRAELERRFPHLAAELTPAGGLWVAYPKKTSGKPTDLSFAAVQEVGLAAGLVDNKSCAIDETWTAVRFVRRLADR
jgi:DNA-binding transcriptional ArsR family regulator